MKKQEKITYKTRPIRMDDKTWETLKKNKILSGKSWNLYLLNIIEKKK